MDYAQIAREARTRKTQLEKELAALDKLIESAEALAGYGVDLDTDSKTPKAATTRKGAVNPTREHTARLLREHGRPLQTAELVPMLRDAGVEIGGKDPIATLSARLSNSEQFKVQRGIGWWFADEEPPHPNYPSIFEEPGQNNPAKEHSGPARYVDIGGSEDAAALVTEPDRQ